MPRRHPLHPSEARPWLDSPSPVSSRPSSPAAPTPVFPPLSFRNLARLDASAPASAVLPARRARHLSFSSLKDGAGAGASRRVSRLSGIGEPPTEAASARGAPDAEEGAARRWVRWMHDRGLRASVVPGAVAAAALVKWCVGLGSYSGACAAPCCRASGG